MRGLPYTHIHIFHYTYIVASPYDRSVMPSLNINVVICHAQTKVMLPNTSDYVIKFNLDTFHPSPMSPLQLTWFNPARPQ